MNPMKYRVSAECSRVIRNILKLDPRERPSIQEVLHSDYVTQMSAKFNWDLKKLLRFRKLRQTGLQSSMISGISYATQNTSQSDSFYFDKRMSGLTSLIEAKTGSSEKNRLISSLSGQKQGNLGRTIAANGEMQSSDGRVRNFEKKNAGTNENVFLKEEAEKEGEEAKDEEKEEYTIKESGTFKTPSQKFTREVNLNVFSRTGSEDYKSPKISQNTSQIKGENPRMTSSNRARLSTPNPTKTNQSATNRLKRPNQQKLGRNGGHVRTRKRRKYRFTKQSFPSHGKSLKRLKKEHFSES